MTGYEDRKKEVKSQSGRSVARIIMILILATVLNAGVTAGVVYSFKTQIDTANQSQQTQGQLIEHRLCTSLAKLSADVPPPLSTTNPSVNPGRIFDQELHTTLSELGPDISCPK